ncbi:hypothetical protein HELRODRAFT_172545 [Helobdella robusta]|uniref:Uncharacterized protein n=1 Tax=Helobdella robusta TaxID=6412 RepID=T1F5H7_HELRO|nr:hypothetical protein HELRODRAFT_172545 [Helobdella robusta]ESO04197.1 hypothetical protein HELRODRAFT_172545 [Helobdella robusta]
MIHSAYYCIYSRRPDLLQQWYILLEELKSFNAEESGSKKDCDNQDVGSNVANNNDNNNNSDNNNSAKNVDENVEKIYGDKLKTEKQVPPTSANLVSTKQRNKKSAINSNNDNSKQRKYNRKYKKQNIDIKSSELSDATIQPATSTTTSLATSSSSSSDTPKKSLLSLASASSLSSSLHSSSSVTDSEKTGNDGLISGRVTKDNRSRREFLDMTAMFVTLLFFVMIVAFVLAKVYVNYPDVSLVDLVSFDVSFLLQYPDDEAKGPPF